MKTLTNIHSGQQPVGDIKNMYFVLRHTLSQYQQPKPLVSETRVKKNQQYSPRRSRTENDRSFARFLATIEALYRATKHDESEHLSHMIVYLKHDTPACFMCDKTTVDMHQLSNRKGSGQYLRFGHAPLPNKIVLFEMTGTLINVDSSSALDKEVPMCSTCYAQRIMPCDYFAPKVCLAECTAAHTIMRRHWEKGGFWDCYTTFY